MALTFYNSADWFNSATNPTCVATWKAGDTVIVYGSTENNPITLATPSATGLGSWATVTSIVTSGEANAYLWSAVATAAGTPETIFKVAPSDLQAKTGAKPLMVR